jgi:hypothetical protein
VWLVFCGFVVLWGLRWLCRDFSSIAPLFIETAWIFWRFTMIWGVSYLQFMKCELEFSEACSAFLREKRKRSIMAAHWNRYERNLMVQGVGFEPTNAYAIGS